MAITRLVDTDDDGTGLTGTIHNNAWLQALYASFETGWLPEAYTPVWTASSVNPAIGNGSIVGRYLNLGGYCTIVRVIVTMGSTTTYGTGSYAISLPVTPELIAAGHFMAYVQDVSAGGTIYNGRGFISGSTVLLLNNDATITSTMTPTSPITFATGDLIHLFGVYFKT